MVAFYNQGDQDIYNQGVKFRPQQKYLLDDYTAPTAQIKPVPTSSGITNTNAFTNSGNDFSVYNPDPNSIVNKNYNPYLSRNAAENSYLPGRSNATDPRYSSEINNMGIKRAQSQYNLANSNRTASGPMTPERQAEVLRTRNDLIQDNRQNYGAQGQYETVPSEFAYSSQTELDKFKDMYPGYFAPKPLEGIPGAIQKYAQNSLLGRAVKSLKYTLATNRRGILENELSGKGVMINDIGQIVASPGNINTAENIMAGYNANKVDASTFQKRRDMINDKMKDPAQKEAKLTALNAAEKNFLDAQSKTDLVFEDIEAEKKKRKKKGNIITRFLTKKKETKAAKEKAAAAAPTGGSYTASGGVTDSNYNQAANIAGGGGGDSATNAQGQTAREATYDGNKNTGTSQGYSQHYARGGRAGYFFGGRVNFKDGGLASIL